MSDYKLVPVELLKDWHERINTIAAETAFNVADEMESMLHAAPAVQGEPSLVVWVLYDATADKKYIKASDDGALAIFDNEAAARRARTMHQGTDYKRCEYYDAPQPAEQKPPKSSLALDAAEHLTSWLEMELCECEGGHTCGYNEVKRTRDALLVAAEHQPACASQSVKSDSQAALSAESERQAPDVPGLTEALRQYQHNDGSGLVFGYDRLLVDQYVAALVEALETVVFYHEEVEDNDGRLLMYYSKMMRKVHEALAAYRKGRDRS